MDVEEEIIEENLENIDFSTIGKSLTTTFTTLEQTINSKLSEISTTTIATDFSTTDNQPPDLFLKDMHFSVLDYSIFIVMLLISTFIGLYYGFISKTKQNNTKEYLLGGKKMNIFPVSASLISSHVSGITMLGIPAEIYGYGTQYWAIIIPAIILAIAMIFIYLPVFHELQLTSCFTYLEKRYDRKVRVTASFVYALQTIIFVPIVIYVPALAFGQVTGINIYLITPLICIVCIFYTTIGGLKAVVWTDTLQFILMIGSSLIVIHLGIQSTGGDFFDVWRVLDVGKRLIFFNMDPSPTARTSFWTYSIGMTVLWLSTVGVSQSCIQRFLAVPDLKKARQSVLIFTIGMIFIKFCCLITGMVIYAKYKDCDPLTAGKIKKLDQILPYFVMDVASSVPGLPGLFIAGIFAAALSTMSTCLNTLAGTIYEDFIKFRLPKISEKKASNILKFLVVILGGIVLSLVFLVEKMGDIFHVSLSLCGVTCGALIGIFSMGMFVPKANTKGAISGAICSIFVVGFILIGAQVYKVKHRTLPMSADKCFINDILNTTAAMLPIVTTVPTMMSSTNEVPWLFQISFMYYSLVGMSIFFLVGVPVSLLTGGYEILDQRLLTPMCRDQKKYLIEKERNYLEIGQALKELKTMNDEKE